MASVLLILPFVLIAVAVVVLARRFMTGNQSLDRDAPRVLYVMAGFWPILAVISAFGLVASVSWAATGLGPAQVISGIAMSAVAGWGAYALRRVR